MQYIHAEFGFEIGLCYREFACDTLLHKEQRSVTMATTFWNKIAINAHKYISARDNENANAITYNRGFSWSTNPKKTFLIVRV